MRLSFMVLTILTLTSSSQKNGVDNLKSIDEKWILENTAEIKLDSTSDIAKMNFSKVGDLIGEAKVVLLGEQDHGDGASFVVKTNLVKFLHEEKGFNVVAFECGFFEMNSLWQTDIDIDRKVDDIKKNLYRIWGQSKQTQELFKYVKEENRKGNNLVIAGFDSRHASQYSKIYYLTQLDSVVRVKNLSLLKESEYSSFKTIVSDMISKEYNYEPKKN